MRGARASPIKSRAVIGAFAGGPATSPETPAYSFSGMNPRETGCVRWAFAQDAETCSVAGSGKAAGLAASSECCRFLPCQFSEKHSTAARALFPISLTATTAKPYAHQFKRV